MFYEEKKFCGTCEGWIGRITDGASYSRSQTRFQHWILTCIRAFWLWGIMVSSVQIGTGPLGLTSSARCFNIFTRKVLNKILCLGIHHYLDSEANRLNQNSLMWWTHWQRVCEMRISESKIVCTNSHLAVFYKFYVLMSVRRLSFASFEDVLQIVRTYWRA